MVLQRGMPVPVWGTASSGEQVTVSIASQSKSVSTPASGKWTVKLDSMPAGGPYTMTVKGTNTVTLDDVYVGEVWQAAGQSNMDTRLNYTEYSSLASEITKANYPLLRYYTIRQPGQTTTWVVVSPSTAGPLSALAYYFGKEIQQKTGLAVGLVVTAVGGTTIASWMDPGTLSAHPEITNSDRGGMWNSWVAPVVGYAIRGTIWIQGEQNTNASDGPSYGERFNWLIRGWRAAWGQGDFPFYFGQLSNIHGTQTDPNNTSSVATVREGQRMALALSGTAMGVNLDIGSSSSWHFPNKPESGHRLALPARAKLYGEPDLVYSGPLYLSKSISGNKVTLTFDHVGGGLVAKDGGALKGFAIAGATGAWVWGDATISGNTVVVSSASVSAPTRVRYAWGDNPVSSLYNKEGLPASSFTTESPDLPASTAGGTGGAGGGGATGNGGTNGPADGGISSNGGRTGGSPVDAGGGSVSSNGGRAGGRSGSAGGSDNPGGTAGSGSGGTNKGEAGTSGDSGARSHGNDAGSAVGGQGAGGSAGSVTGSTSAPGGSAGSTGGSTGSTGDSGARPAGHSEGCTCAAAAGPSPSAAWPLLAIALAFAPIFFRPRRKGSPPKS